MIDEQVRKLVCYGLERGLFTERDEIYVTNRILEILQLDEYNCDTVFSDVDLEETLKALLTAPDRPTAMLVSDDILAVVLEQFCGKLGLHIPKDLSIVSFNNSLFSRITSPQLTTVDVNPYQLGMEAASQTINHIENPNLLATKIIVPHKLIPRESCCPPPEV